MTIHAQNCTLRSFTLDDVSAFFYMTHNDEKIKKYVPSAFPKDFLDAYEIVDVYSQGDCKNDFYLAIERGKVLLGFIISVRMCNMSLDTSAVIFKQYRGKGIMTQAINVFKNWLKENTEYKTLSLQIRKDNKISLHQSKKCGAKLKCEDEHTYFMRIHIR
ncbi:MAG: GNAT family N-acetyltransferase [Clostridia bacterium]|nr:GNAT family N-acetyltransferase [Clostridia bacterium]